MFPAVGNAVFFFVSLKHLLTISLFRYFFLSKKHNQRYHIIGNKYLSLKNVLVSLYICLYRFTASTIMYRYCIIDNHLASLGLM